MSEDDDPSGQFDERAEFDDGEYDMQEDLDECGFPFDCGMMPDGQCLKAGSEECDWECGLLG